MTVRLETTIKRFSGESIDEKPGRAPESGLAGAPQVIPVGSIFRELDTGDEYEWTGIWPWVLKPKTTESLLGDIRDALWVLQRDAAVTRAATAATANELIQGADFPIEDD